MVAEPGWLDVKKIRLPMVRLSMFCLSKRTPSWCAVPWHRFGPTSVVHASGGTKRRQVGALQGGAKF